MSRILIVDDDAHIRELAAVFLKREGFDIVEAADGLQAIEMLASVRVDLVVLDIMMPNLDGWELCRQLKEAAAGPVTLPASMPYDLPVLMLTAKGDTSQKLKGFQLGADDYLVKPFEPLELVARAKALLKRYRIAVSQTVEVGGLRMDRSTCQVRANGQELTLPKKEFELLFKLASSQAGPSPGTN